MATLHLYWLGTPRIERDGRPLRLEMRKSLALLAYLSLSPQHATRETLAALFWPEYDQQHALANLRRNLSSLAKSLPSGLLEVDRETIGLRGVDWLKVDVDEFQEQLAFIAQHSHPANTVCLECSLHLEKAATTYVGDFFQGFNLKDCPEFDQWQYSQQDSLRSQYADVLQKLAAYYRGECAWEKAIRYAKSWLALDRLNESAQRMLIGLYSESSQRSMALRQYENFRALLQNELGQAPEAETLSLYQGLLSREVSGSGESVSARAGTVSPGAEPLIKTKLYIPPLRVDRVARPRLLELLDAGSQRSLTLVSAPAGFGKTTLLASWAAHTDLPIAWFSVDEGDNDPVRFVAYLIAALDSVLPSNLSDQFQAFTQSLHPSVEPTLIQLINHLAAESGPFVLILDDYQFIHSLDVHNVLAFLLEKIPACLHLIIATRRDPPISLALLRARDQLAEIRMGHLRFSLEESNGFLKQVMSLHLSNEDVSALEARTEGWVAGLQMAALAIRTVVSQPTMELAAIDSTQALSQYIEAFSGSNRYIMDYLGEEVLSRRSPEIRDFLLQTSILERFSGPLCDAVTGTKDSQDILEGLEKENLFLVPLDSERHWYRYHHLFAELLRFKLEEAHLKSTGPVSAPSTYVEELHLRAADWLEKNRHFGEAIHHFLTARQYDHAATLIEAQTYPMLFSIGQLYTMQEWLAKLPVDMFKSRPRLNIAKAWTLISPNQFAATLEQLETAWQIVQERQDVEASSLLGEIALIRGVLAEMSSRDVTAMRQHALLAWEKLPDNDLMLRGLAAWLLGVSYLFDGETRNAEKYLLQAISLCRKAGNIYFTLVSIVDFSTVLSEQGRSREAYDLLLQTQQEMTSVNRQSHPRLGHLYICSSRILLQWNRLEEAEKQLRTGIDLAAQDVAKEIPFFGLSTLPYLKLAQGKRKEAIRLAHECLEGLESYPLPYLPSIIKSNLVPFWIHVDDHDQIEEWLGNCELDPNGPISYRNESIYTSLAKVLIWQGRVEEALKVLAQLQAYAESRSRAGKLFYVMALQALAYKQTKSLDIALEKLEASLRLAKSGGYIRPIVDEGAPMEELLQLGVTRGIWKRAGLGMYVNNILKVLHQSG